MAGARPPGCPAVAAARDRGSPPPPNRDGAAPTFFVSLVLAVAALSHPRAASGQVLTRINCGGGEVIDRHGNVWQADNFQTPLGGGELSGYYEADLSRELTNLPKSIAASPNWAVYLTERYEKKSRSPVLYIVPTHGAGTYRVLLHFADTCPCTFQRGTFGRMRKFGVEINNQEVMHEYDIGAEVGWGSVAIKMFHVTVGDGDNITIQATHGSIQNPFINGIEIFRGRHNECSLGRLTSFMCHDPGAGCVAPELRCNNELDCADGSDERACTSSLDNGFEPQVITRPPTLTPTTHMPTPAPSAAPTTAEPTAEPSRTPTSSVPSAAPSGVPTTGRPTGSPTTLPTGSEPTVAPSVTPTTLAPTPGPSDSPTSSAPSAAPSAAPTGSPLSSEPTEVPTVAPSAGPSTSGPTIVPSLAPTSLTPTASPNTALPTAAPSTSKPTTEPTNLEPTISFEPTSEPSTPQPTVRLNDSQFSELDLQAKADAVSDQDAEAWAAISPTNLVVVLSVILVAMMALGAVLVRRNRGRLDVGDAENPRGKLGQSKRTWRKKSGMDGLEWDATGASTIDGDDLMFKQHESFDLPDGHITKIVTSSGIFKAVSVQSPGATHAMVSIGSPTGETNLDEDDVGSECSERMSVADSMFSYTPKPLIRKQLEGADLSAETGDFLGLKSGDDLTEETEDFVGLKSDTSSERRVHFEDQVEA